jgi:hypothetical protein
MSRTSGATWYLDAGLSASQAAQLFALVDGVTLQCLVLSFEARRALVEQTVFTFLRPIDRPLDHGGTTTAARGGQRRPRRARR